MACLAGLAVTDSPVSWDTVPWALGRLTAEFEMGSGSGHPALTTRPAKHVAFGQAFCGGPSRPPVFIVCGRVCDPDTDHESDQADRAISTGQLSALPRVHLQPIHVVVFHGSRGSSRFKGGFPLRCLQRLSRPDIATLHCGWRHNRSTRGPSIPVLSY